MRITLVLVAIAALLVAAAPVSAKVSKLETKLSGANEMPAADPDGSGTAQLRLNRAKKKVCFEIRVRKIGQVVAAHIHKGGKSVASGPIVLPLIETASNKTKFERCVKHVKRSLISAILKHPRRYYVNVHTPDFPAGAIRGQLHKP
jgi:CHRD domain-containing protein